MSNDVMSPEMAEEEFIRFMESMDLEHEDVEDNDKVDFEHLKRILIKQLKRGHLAINDNGEAVYTPFRPNSKFKEPITFHERSGASIVSMGKQGKNEGTKVLATMAEMCKVSPATFSGLVGPDFKTCEAIFILLAV